MQSVTKALTADAFTQNLHTIEPSEETEQRITRLAYNLQKISHFYFKLQCESNLAHDIFDPDDFKITLEHESPAAQFAQKADEPCQATVFSRRNSM